MARQYFFTGAAAPTTTPVYNGSVFVDTAAGRVYIATGTSSSSDWDIMPVNSSEITTDEDLNLQGIYKIRAALSMQYQASAEITIATGAVTQTQTLNSIDTEADAAADDLDTLTILTNSNVAVLKLENSARIVTLKHGTGNFSLPNAQDIIMKADVLYHFVHDATNWIYVGDINENGEDTLSDGANIAWNLQASKNGTVTLAGNRTLDNPTNLVAGESHVLRVVQDGTGTRTLAYGSAYKFAGGTAPTLTAGAGGAVDLLEFYCDGTNMNMKYATLNFS